VNYEGILRKVQKMKETILLNLIILLAASLPAPAATRLVPSEYPTIRAGTDAAGDGDIVVVMEGM